MLHRIVLAGLVAAASTAGATQPMDCFNDDEVPPHSGALNDLQPPEVARTPSLLRITDSDLEAVLEAIAEHERRRADAAADNGS